MVLFFRSLMSIFIPNCFHVMLAQKWLGDFSFEDIIYILVQVQRRFVDTKFSIGESKSELDKYHGLYCESLPPRVFEVINDIQVKRNNNENDPYFGNITSNCILCQDYIMTLQ